MYVTLITITLLKLSLGYFILAWCALETERNPPTCLLTYFTLVLGPKARNPRALKFQCILSYLTISLHHNHFHVVTPTTSITTRQTCQNLFVTRSSIFQPHRKSHPVKNSDVRLPPNHVCSTPQNTPANNAPISSHAQQPGVASIKEGRSLHPVFITCVVFSTIWMLIPRHRGP